MVSANWLLLLFLYAVHYRAAECSALQQDPKSGNVEIKPHGDSNTPPDAEELPQVAVTPEGTENGETVQMDEAELTPLLHKFKIPDWLKKLLKWKTKDKVCTSIRKKGGTPQSKHSPLKFFGYLNFDTGTKQHSISPGLTLSVVNGYPVPIQVGSRDYVLQGSPGTVILFLGCFRDYFVRGSALGNDGHWNSEPQTEHPLFMQVQNVGPNAFGSIRGLIAQQSLEAVLSAIAPEEAFFGAVSAGVEAMKGLGPVVKGVVGKVLDNRDFVKVLADFASYLGTNVKDAKMIWDKLAGMSSLKERIKGFKDAWLEERRKRGETEWEGANNIDPGKKITVTFTMYPQPENGVRATFKYPSNIVTVGEAIPPLLELLKMTNEQNSATSKAAKDG